MDGKTYYLYNYIGLGSYTSSSCSQQWLWRGKEYAYIFMDLSDAKKAIEKSRANYKKLPEIFIDTYECTKSESI